MASVSSGGLRSFRIDEAGDGEDGTELEQRGTAGIHRGRLGHEDGDDGGRAPPPPPLVPVLLLP